MNHSHKTADLSALKEDREFGLNSYSSRRLAISNVWVKEILGNKATRTCICSQAVLEDNFRQILYTFRNLSHGGRIKKVTL